MQAFCKVVYWLNTCLNGQHDREQVPLGLACFKEWSWRIVSWMCVNDVQRLLNREFIGHLLNCNSSFHVQVYRLHQLNRAAQLVTALSFSVKGAETTPQTLAINSSLGTLFHVLQFLGVICIWSLSSFLMRFFPSSAVAPDPWSDAQIRRWKPIN